MECCDYIKPANVTEEQKEAPQASLIGVNPKLANVAAFKAVH